MNKHTPPAKQDPATINARLYNQVSMLLDQLETKDPDGETHITLKERIAALIAIGRLQVIFMGLRKEKASEPERGAAIKKYSPAFASHDPRRRAQRAGADNGNDGPVDDDDGFAAALGDAIGPEDEGDLA